MRIIFDKTIQKLADKAKFFKYYQGGYQIYKDDTWILRVEYSRSESNNICCSIAVNCEAFWIVGEDQCVFANAIAKGAGYNKHGKSFHDAMHNAGLRIEGGWDIMPSDLQQWQEGIKVYSLMQYR